jgi:LAO/AO transport system kinase
LMVRAFDLSQFDTVLIETVGVGQTELEIMNVADFVSVVLVPESGDSIQGMKAGLLEIADLFVVNKADRPGAEAFKNELEASLNLVASHEDQALVHAISATTGSGVTELVSLFENARKNSDWKKARTSAPRLQSEARALLREDYEREIEKQASQVDSPAGLIKLFK